MTPLQHDVKDFLQTLPESPGVYRMLDKQNKILYVGKACNLKKRVSSYFQKKDASAKQQLLMRTVVDIDITSTHTETEALLLECQLIKQLKPKFNVLLRDDKSYPYIYVSTEHTYPRFDLYRGGKKTKGQYFGPYPSTLAVRSTLNLLQKLFKLRQCNNTFFANRTRPCLQYQIKRCSAPCVQYITPEAYQEQVHYALMLLEGKSDEVIQALIKQMERCATEKNYEEAAKLRDKIADVRHIQQKQYVANKQGDSDVVALAKHAEAVCIHQLTVRHGEVIASQNHFPKITAETDTHEILSAFLSQYYLTHYGHNLMAKLPKEIIINAKLVDSAWLERTLQENSGKRMRIITQVRGTRQRWLDMAIKNAELALTNRLISTSVMYKRFTALQKLLGLAQIPQRIECFDISHTQGIATVAACVVFNNHGPVKPAYRRYNIKLQTPGDDYAALYEAIMRRYVKVKTEEGIVPDIVLIDGGKGQLKQAEKVLGELQLSGVIMMGIAKGPGRKAGLEILYISGQQHEIHLPPDSPALHLLQQVRDEAHRYAIAGHRQQRAKIAKHSVLEDIPGIGAAKRKELLKQFGGLQAIQKASIESLEKVPGISRKLAEQIYNILQKT